MRRSRAQVKCWATIPVPDSQPVITDLGWHTDFAQHYVKVGLSKGVGVATVTCPDFICEPFAVLLLDVCPVAVLFTD